MRIDGWKYYNHAAVPSTAPHEEANVLPIKDGSIWNMDGSPLLARWTTEFDCGYETNWWYVIKDTPFDIETLKAKRRYEINKGNKHFLVREIEPAQWAECLYEVAIAAFATYPESYRPNVSYDQFTADIKRWDFYKVYGAFSVEDDTLCGYACLTKRNGTGKYIDFSVMKAIPEREKLGLNAAMVYKIVADHNEFLSSGGYICDGARSINHETAFQDYLEKYFGFRKAFCRLHIAYRPPVDVLISLLYPFRKLLSKMGSAGIVGKCNALLRMEEIHRMKA